MAQYVHHRSYAPRKMILKTMEGSNAQHARLDTTPAFLGSADPGLSWHLQAALERLMTTWSEAVCATARLWNTPDISEFLIEQEGDKLEPVSSFAELLDRPQGLILSQQILASLQTGIDLAEVHLQVRYLHRTLHSKRLALPC